LVVVVVCPVSLLPLHDDVCVVVVTKGVPVALSFGLAGCEPQFFTLSAEAGERAFEREREQDQHQISRRRGAVAQMRYDLDEQTCSSNAKGGGGGMPGEGRAAAPSLDRATLARIRAVRRRSSPSSATEARGR
jgi:hypothetical protein